MNTIILRTGDKMTSQRAAREKCQVIVTNSWEHPQGPVLFARPGATIPWDLLPAAWQFLERWDAAAPLWRYGVLAADVGGPTDRARTEAVIRDLRVPLYATELVFFSDRPAAHELLNKWRAECDGGDERLAFLRALYQIKPIFLALPRSWLAEVRQREVQDARTAASRRYTTGLPLVRVQIGPNSYVTCQHGDEAKTLARFQQMRVRAKEAHGR